MCCKNFWKRIAPFFLTVTIGLLAVNIFLFHKYVDQNQKIISLNEIIKIQDSSDSNFPNKLKKDQEKQKGNVTSFLYVPEAQYISIYPVRVISEPPVQYTDLAIQIRTEGIVVLRVNFLANSKIGRIAVEKGLPFGLTEQAVSAAKKIKFEPYQVHGMYKNSVETVIYTFTID